MENRNGLAVNAALTRATGTAEREAALAMLGLPQEQAPPRAPQGRGRLRSRRLQPHPYSQTAGRKRRMTRPPARRKPGALFRAPLTSRRNLTSAKTRDFFSSMLNVLAFCFVRLESIN